MATATVNYSGISDTVMCARTMFSDVSGSAQRESEYKARNTVSPVVDASDGNVTLSYDDLQNAIDNVCLVNRDTTNASLFVGADTQAVALQIVQQFNLQSNDDRRVLKFQIMNSSGAWTGSSTGLISFGNDAGSTSTYVKTTLGSGSATGIALLFSSGNTGLNGAGATRTVVLSGTGVTGTTPTVNFQIFDLSM